MIDTAVYDFLHHPDHLGQPGMIRSILSMETVSRLALPSPGACADASVDRVSSAVSNLAAKLDQILEARAWTVAAEGEVASLADEVLSRMDVDRIRLDYDRGRRAAAQKLAELESNSMDDVDPSMLIELRHVLAMSYVDYEGRLFDAVDARYKRAGSSAVGWAHYVVYEIRRLAGGAAVLLGTTEHSGTRLASCPWCGQSIGLSTADADLAVCAGCRRHWRLSDGTAARVFAEWRDNGWEPRRWTGR